MDLSDHSRTLQVAIVCGGQGSTRPDSLASARSIALELARLGHLPKLIDTEQVSPEAIAWPDFHLCHVALADDGRYHRYLQGRGVPHTGSSAEAIEYSASRTGARQFFLRFDVPTPAFVLLRRSVSPLEAVARVASLGYPLIVRPDDRRLTSARLVRNADELADAVFSSFEDADRLMCERYLSGRAYSVVLLGEQTLSPVPSRLEGVPSADGAARLSPAESQQLQHAASIAGIALGVSGLAQVEAVLDDQGRTWVLEVSPLPSLADNSCAVQAAAEAGMSLSDLCQWMVSDCLLAESLR